MVTRRKPLAMKFSLPVNACICDNFRDITSLSVDNKSFDLSVNVRDLFVFRKRLVVIFRLSLERAFLRVLNIVVR